MKALATSELPTETTRWFVALTTLLCFGLLVTGYVFAQRGEAGSLAAWSLISAAVASLLYATSFSMGIIGYYARWQVSRHGYQKQLGLLAYFCSLFYCGTLLILYPESYHPSRADDLLTLEILLGLCAMDIFTAMALTSVRPIAERLTPETIKFILGLGFIGYALLVIRAIFIEFDLWLQWFSDFEGFPPGRLVLSLIAIIVLLLRASIPFHRRFVR